MESIKNKVKDAIENGKNVSEKRYNCSFKILY